MQEIPNSYNLGQNTDICIPYIVIKIATANIRRRENTIITGNAKMETLTWSEGVCKTATSGVHLEIENNYGHTYIDGLTFDWGHLPLLTL